MIFQRMRPSRHADSTTESMEESGNGRGDAGGEAMMVVDERDHDEIRSSVGALLFEYWGQGASASALETRIRVEFGVDGRVESAHVVSSLLGTSTSGGSRPRCGGVVAVLLLLLCLRRNLFAM